MEPGFGELDLLPSQETLEAVPTAPPEEGNWNPSFLGKSWPTE